MGVFCERKFVILKGRLVESRWVFFREGIGIVVVLERICGRVVNGGWGGGKIKKKFENYRLFLICIF